MAACHAFICARPSRMPRRRRRVLARARECTVAADMVGPLENCRRISMAAPRRERGAAAPLPALAADGDSIFRGSRHVSPRYCLDFARAAATSAQGAARHAHRPPMPSAASFGRLAELFTPSIEVFCWRSTPARRPATTPYHEAPSMMRLSRWADLRSPSARVKLRYGRCRSAGLRRRPALVSSISGPRRIDAILAAAPPAPRAMPLCHRCSRLHAAPAHPQSVGRMPTIY